MRRNSLGDVSVDIENYWSAGKSSEELRCNETVLYAEIDRCQSYAATAKSKEELQEQYSKMDMFYLCLKAVEMYALNAELLRMAGVVIGNMVNEGAFSKCFNTIEAENRYVIELTDKMYKRTEMSAETDENSNFMTYYIDNVVNLNYYHNYDGSKTLQKPRLSGLSSSSTTDDWSAQIREAGAYFLYALNEDTVKNDKDFDALTVREKIQTQNKMIEYFHGSANNMTRNSILINAEAGLHDKTGCSPKEAIEKFKQEARGEVKGLGSFLAIAAVVLICVALVCKVAEAIYTSYVQNKAQEKINQMLADAAKPDDATIKGAAAVPGDVLAIEKAAEEAKAAEDALMNQVNEYLESKSNGENHLSNAWVIGGIFLGVVGLVGAIILANKKKKQ